MAPVRAPKVLRRPISLVRRSVEKAGQPEKTHGCYRDGDSDEKAEDGAGKPTVGPRH